MTKLMNKKCSPCDEGTAPLSPDKIKKLLSEIDGWLLNDVETEIYQYYKFTNFFKTMAFVNAVAWVANNEGHHPTMEVGFNHCRVHFTTHAAKGLTENDFICAAKLDMIIQIGSEI